MPNSDVNHSNISTNEFEQADKSGFESSSIPLNNPEVFRIFITESSIPLSQLRLAALAQIREVLIKEEQGVQIQKEAINPFRITEAYRLWGERQTESLDIQPEIFAEQVAYIFFIRLLLVRILEDKHIIRPRLASDGGFVDKHFFQQAIFDWFNPDDYLMVVTLEFLCRYNFSEVTSDIIGFTYEEYIDRIARNRRGHFLTRTEVVDYMLDLLDYNGRKMIGRTILDPACGSGSFLVRAAYRYRQGLVEYLGSKHSISGGEAALAQHPEVRLELAREYLKALTTLFYGMELNPFACYLAEMNLLIISLSDVFVLQEAGKSAPIERFNIYNTNSLLLPREILESSSNNGVPVLSDRLSDRLMDEAYPIKAKLSPSPEETQTDGGSPDYAKGFYFIVSNPPYINPSQVASSRNYAVYPFFGEILSGTANTYLLFLKLGLYYLAPGGSMIYIIPLTILGDTQGANARKALKQPPFRPTTLIRFFSGNVLFAEVDQAVAIVRIDRTSQQATDWEVTIGGGYTIEEARASTFKEKAALVLNSTPDLPEWQAAWLVSPEKSSYQIWQEVLSKATSTLEQIWSPVLQIREGDVRGDHINILRISNLKGDAGKNQSGDIAIYKGADVQRFSPVNQPSDYVRFSLAPRTISPNLKAALKTLERIKGLDKTEEGLVIRNIARLNTREQLIATWFERDGAKPYAFTNKLWRFILTDEANKPQAKAFLALVSSKTVVYLLNLFSSNNGVMQGELARIPIPDPATLPVVTLAGLADSLLTERAKLEKSYLKLYGVVLPEIDTGKVYLPPSRLKPSQISTLTLGNLEMRGEVQNTGKADQKIKALQQRGKIENRSGVADFSQVLNLFLSESGREEEKWNAALHWILPEPNEAAAWLTLYNQTLQEAQASWDKFVSLQQEVDEEVANWYGFTAEMKATLEQGVAWARRRKS
ncbi:MAG: N-6 DNA methylase [Chloroflexi bacterium]|nr:N-6 DNA methylase [Chloroflexota bacterium]